MKPCAKCKVEQRLRYCSYCRRCANARKREYEARNPDRKAKWNQTYRERNPDSRKLQHEKNKDRENEQSRAWHRKNRLASRRNDIIGRARTFGHDDHFTLEELVHFINEHPACEDCGSTERLTIGHMIPLMYPVSTNTLGNLIRQCRRCNDHQSVLLHPRVRTPELAALFRFWDGPEATENGKIILYTGAEEGTT